MKANFNSTIIQSQLLIKQLSVEERWTLLKWLLELLQQESQTASTEIGSLETSDILPKYPAAKFYGCIEDDTFFRHSQNNQPEREPII